MKEGWVTKRLYEIGSFQRGKGIQKVDFVDSGMPCIHYGQIHTSFGISTNQHLSEISEELFSQSVIAKTGDLLFALTSEDVEGSCKATAWLGHYDVAVSSDAAIFRHTLFPKFVSYFFGSKAFFRQKQKFARGFKVTHIKTTDVANFELLIPPLVEQERIVAELDLLTEIIDKQKAQLKELDTLAQSIFYDMFGDPVENEKGWEKRLLKDVCTALLAGGDVPKNDFSERKTDVHSVPILSNGVGEKAIYGYTSQAKIFEESITISGRGTIGYCEVRNKPFFPVVRLIVATPNKTIVLPMMLKYIVDSMHLKGIGVAIPQLTIPMVKNLAIIIPPLQLQQKFIHIIQSIEQQKAAISQSVAETQKLFDYTMDKYFG